MNQAARTALGFVVAPAVTVCVILLLMGINGSAVSVGLVYSALVAAYAVMLVLGTPAFLMTRPWRIRSARAHALLGITVALLPAAGLYLATKGWFLPVVSLVGAGVGGVAFSLLVAKESNNAIDRPRDR